MHTKWSVFAEQQLLWTMSDKQIWLNEAASHSSLSLQIRNTWWTHERMRARAHTHTLGCKNALITAQILGPFLFVMCADTAQWIWAWGNGNFSLNFHTCFLSLFYLSLHFMLFFFFIFLFPRHLRCLLTNTGTITPEQLAALKLVKPLLGTRLHTNLHTHNTWHNTHHRKSPEPEQAGKLWKTRIQFGTYGA